LCTPYTSTGATINEIVEQDWQNVRAHFKENAGLIVAFDDVTSPGVVRLRDEIRRDNTDLLVLDLNFNQFFVCSTRIPLRRRLALETLGFVGRWHG